MLRLQLSLLLLLVLALCEAGAAQQPLPAVDGWNSARALELIQRAQARRRETNADTGLVNYRSDARLYVYFYLDRQDTGERNLVKTDQLALDVFWQAPDLTKQRIVGWRDQKSLPTNINYHLDHLTVVQENFGDEIHLGDGDEVQGVPHPAAFGAETFYEYRLADSLTLRLPGAPEPVRVYELQVRPRDLGQPGIIGSVFVDRRGGDLVRLDFTFTPSAYRDRFLDYINISLDNGLWKGRFWLPNEQRVEIRRQIPQLDIPAGSVIRGTMRVGNYRFNEALPPSTFAGPRVVALPRRMREQFPFEQDLLAEIREEGLGPQMELGEIRREAMRLARSRALSGVGGVRLSLGSASELFRYNRAEGAVVGLGLTAPLAPGVSAGVRGGWAFGAEHPLGEVRLERETAATEVALSAYGNRPRDVGLGPVASGALNTLSSLFAAEDYTDLFYASGAALEAEHRFSPFWMLSAGVRAEAHRSADAGATGALFGDDFRPVRPVDEGPSGGDGQMLAASLSATRRAPSGTARWWGARLGAETGWFNPEGAELPSCAGPATDCGGPANLAFVQPRLSAELGRRWTDGGTELRVGGSAGFTMGEIPRQQLYLLGGRGTVPGYRFRSFGGDRFALANVTASTEVWRPWLRLRGLAAAGWSDVGEPGERALRLWGAGTTDGIRPSIGVGAGIFHDIIHVDVARGLGDHGVWELIVEARPSFWDFL